MGQCSDDAMRLLLDAMARDDGDALEAIDRLLADHPDDARLHFLRGSILAGVERPIEAHAAFVRAVEIAPDFAIARFQLGFFELTSGEVARATRTWQPLDRLPDGHFLRHFVQGLLALTQDRFDDAIMALERGIAVNAENEALNCDMRLLIGRCRDALGDSPAPPAQEASATSFLLDQFGNGRTTH